MPQDTRTSSAVPILLTVLLLVLICPHLARGQANPATATENPVPKTQPATSLAGTILDLHGAPVSGATITLLPFGKLGERTATSGSDGAFTFAEVQPGEYRLDITGQGYALYASGQFTVRPGEALQLPPVSLKISATTTVDVVASKDQIAIAEIHLQEQQRVLGVFQNFYTSYIWDAAPMPTAQKYKLAFRALVDIPGFVIVGGIAGAEQYNGTYPGYGPGIEGYGKRYGAAFADAASARIIGSAILPSLLHQDPRYFYQGSGSIPSRALHAVAFTFTARGDNGRTQPNYSHLLGSLAAAGLANTYHPATSRSLGDTFQTFGIDLTGNIIGNLVREFVLRHLESIPAFANGKH